ncbi:hypothetical protein BDV12DRAFT_196620 [Aspergillus spectabilis]
MSSFYTTPGCPVCRQTVRPTCLSAGHLRPCTTCGKSFAPITHATCRSCTQGETVQGGPWDHDVAMTWLAKQANRVYEPDSEDTVSETSQTGPAAVDAEQPQQHRTAAEAALILMAIFEEDQRRMDATEGLLRLSRGEDETVLAVHALTVLKWQATNV